MGRTLTAEQKRKMQAGRRRARRERERERKELLERIGAVPVKSSGERAWWGGYGDIDSYIRAVIERTEP